MFEKPQSALDAQKHKELLQGLNQNSEATSSAIGALIQFLQGNVSKTEVLNQLQSISTPDIKFVVDAVNRLDDSVRNKQIDWSPVIVGFKHLASKVDELPKSYPEAPEAVENVSIKNLPDYHKDFKELLGAIKSLDLHVEAPKVDVKVPETKINVEKPNLEPIKLELMKVVTAIQNQKYPEMPKVDLQGVEKRLEGLGKWHGLELEELKKANQNLKKLIDKPVSSGGGGGGGYVFQDTTGKLVAPQLTSGGAVPVDIQDASVTINGDVTVSSEVEVKNDTGNPIPISASSLPLPTGASQEHTTAASPSSVRLTDGASFYKPTTPSDTQPISGSVSVSNFPATQAVSGTVTASNTTGSVASGSVNSGNPVKIGGVVTTSLPTLTNGNMSDLLMGAKGGVLVSMVDNSANIAQFGTGNADGQSAATVGLTATRTQLYELNSAGTYDRRRMNTSGALIAAGATTTQTNIALTTYNANKLTLLVNISAGAGSVTVTINGSSSSGYSYTLLTSTALTGTGVTPLRIFPGATPSANSVANDMIPRDIKVTATVSGSVTYGIDYILGV